MTAHAPIDAVQDDVHRQATDDVNRWRGRCVECFARIEQVVDEAVAAMEASGREKSVRRVPMFGARIEMLRGALKTQSFAPIGKKALKTLQEIDPYLKRRNALVHGVSRVWIDGRGSWLWTYEFTPAGKDPKAERDMIEQSAGEELESELAKHARSLHDLLRNLITQVQAVTE
jgi:hypothetical protein